jgi:hypothetical protein
MLVYIPTPARKCLRPARDIPWTGVAGRVHKNSRTIVALRIAHDETRTFVASRPSGTFGLMDAAGAGQPFVFKELVRRQLSVVSCSNPSLATRVIVTCN